jgi:hypothetical protein
MPGLMDGFREWRFTPGSGDSDAFELECTVSGPASASDIEDAWSGKTLPHELVELWSECREAELFRDAQYGQWGLRILPPSRSVEVLEFQVQDRPSDFRADDVVVAEFLGDLELLVLAPSEEGNRRVMVALELDPRDEWYAVGSSLEQFLQRYLEAQGKKFWE